MISEIRLKPGRARLIKVSIVGQRPTFRFYRLPGAPRAIETTYRSSYTTAPVLVTDAPSCPSLDQGYKINRSETLASFFSQVFASPLNSQLSMQAESEDDRIEKSGSKIHNCIKISRRGQGDLTISFKRTVRVPEDGKSYLLPPDMGNFPLFSVDMFKSRLAPEISMQGGIFLPMYRELKCPFCIVCAFALYSIGYLIAIFNRKRSAMD